MNEYRCEGDCEHGNWQPHEDGFEQGVFCGRCGKWMIDEDRKRWLDLDKPGASFAIMINGKYVYNVQSPLTYEKLVELAGKTGNPTAVYHKARDKEDGILSPGQSVRIKPGTIFDVVHTGNA